MEQTNYFQSMRLAGDILEKRSKDDVSFRDLQEITGIDRSVLHSIECGNVRPPKLNDFFILCNWLDQPMEKYFLKPKIKSNGKNKESSAQKGGAKLIIKTGAEKGKKAAR
jgi:transcriptional regulator with XRE-family HTH domain